MKENLYIAIDLGAGSGRVFLCGLGERELMLEEIHRFHYPPIESEGHLRWDFSKIFGEIKIGLREASETARKLNCPIYSIGVDSWGVDYGLIDEKGELLENPVCYRDNRTQNSMPEVFAKIPREKIFDKTGIQFLVFNTLFQLHAQNGTKNSVAKLLLIPDLINYFLTGKVFAEYSNATTTQLVNAKNGNWDTELLESIGLSKSVLGEIIPSGTDLGLLKPELASELNLKNVRVIAPATHDTGSAIAGAPLEKNWAYISSGTWSLVGIERDKPLINEEVARHNFTNEGGVFGTTRFLKNVMGLWIFESCRHEWKRLGYKVEYETLLQKAQAIKEFRGFIFPDDERFLNPPRMLKAIKKQLEENGQIYDKNPAVITKIILDSLAFRYASVLDTIENLTNNKIEGVQIVGGGGKNDYLNQMTANICGKTVKAGLTEATVTGNLIVQAVASHRFKDLAEARKYVGENVELKTYQPISSDEIEKAKQNYLKLEKKFLGS